MNSFWDELASTYDLPRVKPNCGLASILHLLKKFTTLLCMHFSTTFESKGSTDIGLKVFISLLSPILNIGPTQATLNSSWNSPCTNEMLISSAGG